MKWKICGISELPALLPWATHILSISSPGSRHEIPPLPGPPVKVLRIDMDDVELVPRTMEGMEIKFCPPETDMIRQILEFGLSVPDDSNLLVHCQMGVSRSTAAMMAILAARNPSAAPAGFMKQIAATRDIAMPNRLVIRLADQLLHKKGALSECVNLHWEMLSRKWR